MNAAALVVGPAEGPGAALAAMARSLGFACVDRFSSLRRAERQLAETRLLFFLCAAVPDIASLRPTAEALRRSSQPGLRFAPLIYFCRDASADTIRACIGMGFDDVIALPFAGGDLGERIGRQVGQPQVYYETASYFGPDRRRLSPPRTAAADNGQVRRFEIRRSAETGIEMLSDDLQVVI